jgi:CBS domain-containing protein
MQSLAEPVSKSIRPARPLGIEGTCGAAATAIRLSGCALLPIVRDTHYVGVITERSIQRILAHGVELDSPLEPYVEHPETIPPYATGADALRRIEEAGVTGAVIVDDGGVVWGLIFPSDLFPKPRSVIKPPTVGGMAVPYGVYLTTGLVNSGPSKFGLMLSGAALMFMLTVATIFASGAMNFLDAHIHLSGSVLDYSQLGLILLIFAVLMRLAPISGYHAAEHMVVHAIERSEPLTVAAVSRMPRVHPRCGTNFATGIMIVSLIANPLSSAGPDPLRSLLGILVALTFWRRAGSYVQYWITTRPPSKKQIEAGIRSGKELLKNYSEAKNLRGGPFRQLWSSGMFHVAAGGFLTGAVFVTILYLCGRTDLVGVVAG